MCYDAAHNSKVTKIKRAMQSEDEEFPIEVIALSDFTGNGSDQVWTCPASQF